MVSKWNNPDGSRMKCKIDDCEIDVECKGLCKKHAALSRYYGFETGRLTHENAGKECAFEICTLPARSKGFCSSHYNQLNLGQEQTPVGLSLPCPVPDCGDLRTHRSTLCRRHTKAAWRYSLTPERLIEILDAGCSNRSCGRRENLHIDHDHACCPANKFTGTKMACGDCVRGALCQHCNVALGQVNDDIERLRGLIEYLENAKPAAATEEAGRVSGEASSADATAVGDHAVIVAAQVSESPL